MVEDTWYRCAVPLLEAVAQRDSSQSIVSVGELTDETGIEPESVVSELERLIEAGYLAGDLRKYLTGGDVRPYRLVGARLTGAGARVVGQWPRDDAYDAFLAAVDVRMAEEQDETQRGRWRRLRDDLAEMGKSAVVALAVEAAKQGVFGH